jgi:hypothetical protein
MRDLRGLSNLFRVPLGLSNSTTALALKNALVHVCGMKHLTLVVLLALTPLSWGVEGDANLYQFALSDNKNFYMTSVSG